MKSISSDELEILCADAQVLLGGQLQEILTSDRDVEFEIFAGGALAWLWIDLQPATPFLIHLNATEQKPKLKKKSTPLGLFLKAHGRGRRLSKLVRTEGRTVELHFGDPRKPDELLQVEIRLFPHGTNILVTGNGKKIAWQKPKEVHAPKSVPLESTPRSREEMYAEWLDARRTPAGMTGIEKSVHKIKDATKLLGILNRLEEQLIAWKNPWRDLGEWIKENQSLKVSEDLKPYLDLKARSIAEHIQKAFTLAKKQDQKREGIERRVKELKIEIERINEMPVSAAVLPSNPKSPELSLFHQTESRGRRAQLTDQVDLYVGKSAVDNLALLRKAQSWDLWLHVRDVPGCHAILRRPRGFDIDDDLLRIAAKKVVAFSPQASREIRAGDQFDVTICEVRFVKPVKGDRVGLVNYHNDRTLRVKF